MCNWIMCTDRMPEPGVEVVVQDHSDRRFVAFLTNYKGRQYWYEESRFGPEWHNPKVVEGWLPMPRLAEREANDD